MKHTVEFENCSFTERYTSELLPESKVHFRFELEEVITIQSRKDKQQALKAEVQKSVAPFRWLILDAAYLRFDWYFCGVGKQRTDKFGDLDNLTKPVLDAFTGFNGVLVDDSQIRTLDLAWHYKNEKIEPSILHISISFNNEHTLFKENLYFIQYDGPMCFPVNISTWKDRFFANMLRRQRKLMKAAASATRKLGVDADFYYLISSMDFHRSRLSGIPRDRIINNE